MSVVELYENGVIEFLFKKGLVSPSVPTYIEYFLKFSSHRESGKTYRDSIDLVSKEYRVSSTTIKKAIRIIKNSLN